MQGLEHLGQSRYFDYIPEKIKDRHGNIVSNPAFEEFVNTARPSFDYVPEPGQEKLYTTTQSSQGGGAEHQEPSAPLNTYLIDFDGIEGRQEVKVSGESEDDAIGRFYADFDATTIHSISQVETPARKAKELHLTDVKGIGDVTANKLIDIGVNSADELGRLGIDKFIEVSGFNLSQAEEVMKNLDKLLKEA